MSERPTQTATIVSSSQGAGATAATRPSGQSVPESELTQELVPQAPRQPAPASALPAFPVTRRGYDTTSVDRKVSALLREKAALITALEETRSHTSELEQQLRRLDGTEAPTYADLGGRASELLRLAEEQAAEVTAAARTRADEIVRSATAEAQTLRMHAARDAEDMRMVQLKELDEARTTAMSEVERIRTSAQTEAQDMLAAAERESSQRRLAAQQEADALRTGARREAEALAATAEREVEEDRKSVV